MYSKQDIAQSLTDRALGQVLVNTQLIKIHVGVGMDLKWREEVLDLFRYIYD